MFVDSLPLLLAAPMHWLDAPLPGLYRWTMLGAILLSAAYWLVRARNNPELLPVYIGALAGAFLGAKLAYLFAEGWRDWPLPDRWARLAGGKSVVGGLLGGYGGVELVKWLTGYRKPTGDLFVWVVPLGIALGRVGCWWQGCCLGKPAKEGAWLALRNASGVPRWPASQVELFFQLAMFGVLLSLKGTSWGRDRLFFLYLAVYGAFRFFHEFLRDTPVLVAGLSGYQLLSATMTVLGCIAFVRRGNQAVAATTSPH